MVQRIPMSQGVHEPPQSMSDSEPSLTWFVHDGPAGGPASEGFAASGGGTLASIGTEGPPPALDPESCATTDEFPASGVVTFPGVPPLSP